MASRQNSPVSAGRPRTPLTTEISEKPEETRADVLPEDAKSRPQDQNKPETPSPTRTRPRHKSVAEEAAELVEARRQSYLANSGHPAQHRHTDGEKGHAHDLTDREPMFLGIGTGGLDEFASCEPPVDVVSDSPTGVDFDVYDRAFAAEVERVRSQKGRKRRTTYLTRLVHEKDKYEADEHMVKEAAREIPASLTSGGASAAAKTLNYMGLHRPGKEAEEVEAPAADPKPRQQDKQDRPENTPSTASDVTRAARAQGAKIADLVSQTMRSAKSRTVG